MVNHSISARILGGKCLACGESRISHGAPDPDNPCGCPSETPTKVPTVGRDSAWTLPRSCNICPKREANE
jgi:hypothetical protein